LPRYQTKMNENKAQTNLIQKVTWKHFSCLKAGPYSQEFLSITISFIMALVLLLPSSTVAQQQAGDKKAPAKKKPRHKIQILHKAPRGRDLPDPGQPFKLFVRLKNTRSTQLVLRVLMVQDDRFRDMAFDKSYLDEYDRPTFEIDLNSPLAELQYQFLLLKPDDSILSSPPYQVSRECLPNIDVASIQMDPSVQVRERIPLLVERAAKLEKELSSYDTAIRLAQELRQLIKAE